MGNFQGSFISESGRSELTPTGALRVGVVYAPEPSAFFAVQTADGGLHGVTVDLAEAFARTLNVPGKVLGFSGSGQLVDALEQGQLDVAFMPVDDERRKRVSFGPEYYVVESTCLVRDAAAVPDFAALNDARMTVVGLAETTTIRAAQKALPAAQFKAVSSVSAALELLKAGDVDAVALSRDVLELYQTRFPGSRVLDGAFHAIKVAIAVPKEKPVALEAASDFLEQAKSSGFVEAAFRRAGV